MWHSNCTPEEYSAWRRETVEEAGGLTGYLSYPDLAGWGKQRELQATADETRPVDQQIGEARGGRRLVRVFIERLASWLARLSLGRLARS